MVATRSQSSGRKQGKVDAKDIKNISSIEDADRIKGTVQQWLNRFGQDKYVLLGVKALVQDIFWLIDPILCPIAEAYAEHQTLRVKELLRNATTPGKASTYRTILATWRTDPTKAPEPLRSICVSQFGQQAGHEIAALHEDANLFASLAFFFQPARGSNTSIINDDFGSTLIGPPAAVVAQNANIFQGYKFGSVDLTEVGSPPHVTGPWSFFGTVPDYRWDKVEHWALSMNDYETLRRIGIKTVMFRGGDRSQRLSDVELSLLKSLFTAVENATSLVSAPYDAYAEEDMEDYCTGSSSPALSEMDLSLADHDEEMLDLTPDPNLLIIEKPRSHLIKGKAVQVGQKPNLTLSEEKDLVARYRQRRTSDLQKRKLQRLEAHEKKVKQEWMKKKEVAAAAQTGPGRLVRAGMAKVGGWLYGGREKGNGGVQKVKVVKGREPNVAVGVRAELKSPVMQRKVSAVELSSDSE